MRSKPGTTLRKFDWPSDNQHPVREAILTRNQVPESHTAYSSSRIGVPLGINGTGRPLVSGIIAS